MAVPDPDRGRMRGDVFQHHLWRQDAQRFTTAETGKPCEDFSLVARDCMVSGAAEEREIALFELT
jgi:hypothetical protein